jgi:hypothetical protein
MDQNEKRAANTDRGRLPSGSNRWAVISLQEGAATMPDDAALTIPGTLRIQTADGSVQVMPIDDYLKGVVPTEIGMQKPLEALKAQAIAARSFAVSTRRHALEGFDLCSTTHCQAWKPQNRYAAADRAVDETAGQVVTYAGKVAAAHFFGHCDGHTRNSEDVWSGKVAYYRSVPCICGYTTLYGHGVGMCQRGAVAMANQGASAVEILTHYYTGIKVAKVTVVPRESCRESMIFGQVFDGAGRPKAGERLILEGVGARLNKGTTSDGQFWFTGLPAGTWSLSVQGKPTQYDELRTDGRNNVQLRVAVSQNPAASIRTMPLMAPKQLVGTLGHKGVEVALTAPSGVQQSVYSGSAPDYDPGGFVVPLEAAGSYSLHVLGQDMELDIGQGGLWVRFEAPTS